jgi:Homeodomain-like domain-containing protein
MAADGVPSQDIARDLKISRPTVQLWRQRFLALRVPGFPMTGKGCSQARETTEDRNHSANDELSNSQSCSRREGRGLLVFLGVVLSVALATGALTGNDDGAADPPAHLRT